MKRVPVASLLSLFAMLAAPVLAQTATAPCSAATLSGTYSLTLTGRAIAASGNLNALFEGIGTATYDGVSKVTFSGTDDSISATGQSFTYSGTYTMTSNCAGTITLNTGDHASFSLITWSSGQQFDISGTDTTTGTAPVYVWGGSGSSVVPPGCATASVSGPYTYEVTGNTIAAGAQADASNEAGTLSFDGQGNLLSASYTVSSSHTAAASGSATGAYTVSSNCTGTVTMKDSVSGTVRTLNFVINGDYGQNLRVLESSSTFIGSGTAHNAFDNPSQSIANVANYAYGATPPGSVFTLFGLNLATKPGSAQSVPLPQTLQGASVLVNGNPVPLFYADTMQINAQMPWETQGGSVASVTVKSGSATSNAAAVYVPANGTPGISFQSGTNRAVVVNKDSTLNASNNPAAVNDEVVAYFTGGGPVNPSGKLTTGAASPAGLSPVTDPNASVTVGGVAANVIYIGLTPGSVGLYQANFNVPQLAKGTYAVVITISGTASNTLLGSQDPNPVMTVSN